MKRITIVTIAVLLAGCGSLPKSLEEIEEYRNSPEWEQKKAEWKAKWDERRAELEKKLEEIREFIDSLGS